MDFQTVKSDAQGADAEDVPLATASSQTRKLPPTIATGLAPSLERLRLRLYGAVLAIDSVLILVSFAIAAGVYGRTTISQEAMLPAYLMLPNYVTIALYNGCYSRDLLAKWQKASVRMLLAIAISAALLSFFAFLAKINSDFSRIAFGSALILSSLLMIAVRFAIAKWTRRHFGPSVMNRLVIDAGGPEVRIPHVYHIDAQIYGLAPNIDDPVVLDRLAKFVHNMDEVIVTCDEKDRFAWSEILKGTGVHCEVVSAFARQIGALGIVHHDCAKISTIVVSAGQLGIGARAIKRLFDVALASLALIVLTPVLIACAIAIKIEDGGPVLFLQRRMGRGNRFFSIYKFRSMSVEKSDPDALRLTTKNDARVTRVGHFLRKTSLDELPQILNVLKGEMSLVGPRPHALGAHAGDTLYWRIDRRYWQRHCLRPGITGLAQVRGFRGATDTEESLSSRLRADLEYLRDWSILLDIRIMFSTFGVVVHSQAY